jgi:hypothetical protein
MAFYDEPFGFSIFCDDIRNEVGGKNSYIGVYISNLLVPAFPIALPKFCIVVNLCEPRAMAEVRDWNVTLNVHLPGDEDGKPTIAAMIPPVPKEASDQVSSSSLPDDPDVPKVMVMSAGFILAPLMLKEPGRIKVRAIYKDGGILRLGNVRVEQAPQPSVT